MPPKMYATVSGILFALVALAHLVRLLTHSAFVVGGWSVPSWGSLVAVVVTGFLSYSGFRIAAAAR